MSHQVVLINAAMPPFTPSGYRDGKLAAEAAAKALVDPSFGAAVLKPGGARMCSCASRDFRAHSDGRTRGAAIYGTRFHGRTPVPLWIAMAPASAVLRALGPLRAHAPVSVRNVAAAAVDAALSPPSPGAFRVVDNEALLQRTPTDA
jgi:hypothetical protein